MSSTQPTREDVHMEIGVSFRHNPKIYSFVATGLRLHIGDRVLVRTEKGVDMGEVMELRGRVDAERAAQLMPVVRKATAEDLQHIAEQQEREKQALQVCAEAIARHGLPMKLIDANLSFDNTRLVFFFSADGRVDFRELVRDLARTFRMRIELRQIGVRDEARLLGGLGPCGRRLCCKTFMRDFEPVGIRVAKDQGLALNPAKISGLCDRLMCCLLFEHETYCALREQLPKRGDRVMTEQGPGTVRDVVLIKEELLIALDSGTEVRLPACRVWPEDGEPPSEQPAAEEGAEGTPAGPAAPVDAGPQAPDEMKAAAVTVERPFGQDGSAAEQGKSKRRRRRPRRRRSSGDSQQGGQTQAVEQQGRDQSGGSEQDGGATEQRSGRRRSRRRRKRRSEGGEGQSQEPKKQEASAQDGQSQGSGSSSSRRRRGRRRRPRRKCGTQGAQGSGKQKEPSDGGST